MADLLSGRDDLVAPESVCEPAPEGQARDVLVVGPAWIGDMVMAQSLFISLRRRDPNTHIDVVTPPWSRGVLARMPQVREAIEIPVKHGRFGFEVRRRVGRLLRQRSYEQAIVLPRSLKSALLPFFARVPRRTGFRGELRYGLINDMRRLDRSVLVRTVERFVALGQPRDSSIAPATPRPRLLVDEANRNRLLEQWALGGKRIVCVVPGARNGPSKRWPAEYFGELALSLSENGRRVCIVGSEADRRAGETIRAMSGDRALDLTGRTRLEDIVDLFSVAELVVTNDTGPMHVAAAVGTRVVALYGSTSPEHTPPLTDDRRVLYLDLSCSPCSRRNCPLGHLRCLRDIRPGQVLEACGV